jgi:hypothetical protein
VRVGMLGRQITKVLFSGSSACGQKRETEGMMKPFASCRRIYSPSRPGDTLRQAALMSVVLPRMTNSSAMSEKRAQSFGKVPIDAPASAYGCRREETWKTVLYPTPEAIPAVPRTDTRQKMDYVIAYRHDKSSYAAYSQISVQRWQRGTPTRLWRNAFDWPTRELWALRGLG